MYYPKRCFIILKVNIDFKSTLPQDIIILDSLNT
jgi:hypothetical protein